MLLAFLERVLSLKKSIALCFLSFLLVGCSTIEKSNQNYLVTQNKTIENTNTIDSFENYSNLNKNLKIKIIELRQQWSKFYTQLTNDKDPTEDFHNSDYMKSLKFLLSQRESLAVSKDKLGQLLEQNDIISLDKKLAVSGKEYNIRIISYNVNFYVDALANISDVKNKWIFAQCWNDQEFYFTTLSDGDIHSFNDFTAYNNNDSITILLTGFTNLYYPNAPFVWAFQLNTDGFHESNLFDNMESETKHYIINDKIEYDKPYTSKWILNKNNSYISVEKFAPIPAESAFTTYLNIDCNIEEQNNIIVFSTTDKNGLLSEIKFVFQNGHVLIQ